MNKKRVKSKSSVSHNGRVTDSRRPVRSIGEFEFVPDADDEAIFHRGEENTETVSSMDSLLLPGVFDNDVVILRRELDKYCLGFADSVESLSTMAYPDISTAIFDKFGAHMQKQTSLLRRAQISVIQASFGTNGMILVPEWAGCPMAPTPAQFAHSLKPFVPESVAYRTLSHITAEYKDKLLMAQKRESGLGYDEEKVATVLSDFIMTQQATRIAELEGLFSTVAETLEVSRVPEGDSTRLDWRVVDGTHLPIALTKLMRTLRRIHTDFNGWFLAGIEPMIADTFNWTPEQNREFMIEHFSPLYAELLDRISLEQTRLRDAYADSAVHQHEAIDVAPTETCPSELVYENNDSVIEVAVQTETHLVPQHYPWLSDRQHPLKRGLVGYRVNGHARVFVASALTEELAQIASRASQTLKDPDAFNKLLTKAITGVACGKRYGVEKITSKGGNRAQQTPYDYFTIHKEIGGSTGNTSRLYFVYTTVGDVVTDLPEGVNATDRLIVVIAKTDKSGQNRTLEIINGSSQRTARRRGTGN